MRTPTEPPNLRERSHFKALLAENPNYFGNLADSPHAPTLDIVAQPTYESLVEIGYHSADERLEAIVQLTQIDGYGSDVIGPGSTEFIRYYLSTDNGVTWQDYGVSSFPAFNVARDGAQGPLMFSASISLPHSLLHPAGQSVRMRVLLSWQICPPPNQPDWRPVWGSVRERDILNATHAETSRPHFAKTMLPASNGTDINDQPATNARRAQAYREALEQHQTDLSADAFTALLNTEADPLDTTAPADIPIELRAVALDPNTPESLVAIARLETPASDCPWPQTSAQYVSFWLTGTSGDKRDHYLGSASLSVTPSCSLGYLVARLPVELSSYHRPGAAGPVTLKLRAVLSATRPLSGRTLKIPEDSRRSAEATIFLPPAPAPVRGKLAIVGGIPTADIDSVHGTTLPDARFATSGLLADDLGRPCPFGGLIRIQGPALAPGYSYSIEIRPVDGGPARLFKQPIRLKRRDGSMWTHHPDPESGRYAYVPFEYNVEQLLGEWPSEGDACCVVTLWTFHMDGKPTGMDSCRVQLANSAPDCDLIIKEPDAEPEPSNEPAIVCTYLARDPWFGSTTLELYPASPDVPPALISNTQTPPRGMNWSIPVHHVDAHTHHLKMTVRNRAILDSRIAGRQRVEKLGLDGAQ